MMIHVFNKKKTRMIHEVITILSLSVSDTFQEWDQTPHTCGVEFRKRSVQASECEFADTADNYQSRMMQTVTHRGHCMEL